MVTALRSIALILMALVVLYMSMFFGGSAMLVGVGAAGILLLAALVCAILAI